MIEYKGSCHCGAVRFAFAAAKIEETMRCDCSICARKGIVMSAAVIAPEFIEISDEKGVLSTYRFGTGTARHHFCGRCGVHTFVETRLDPGCYRINLGCVHDLDALRLPSTIYPGREL